MPRPVGLHGAGGLLQRATRAGAHPGVGQALGGQGEITLRTRVSRNFNIGTHKYRLVARIEIIDSGPGIDEALRKKIFYPMVTSRSDGTGLGLSIAQALVSRHHGLIECSSAATPETWGAAIEVPLASPNVPPGKSPAKSTETIPLSTSR